MTEEEFRKEWEAYKKERNERLHRFFVRVVIIFAILGITVSLNAYFTYTVSQTNKEALCDIRHDAERRVRLGEQFFKENPKGIPGVSMDSLRRSIRNSQETVDSLESLNCEPVKIFDDFPAR